MVEVKPDNELEADKRRGKKRFEKRETGRAGKREREGGRRDRGASPLAVTVCVLGGLTDTVALCPAEHH